MEKEQVATVCSMYVCMAVLPAGCWWYWGLLLIERVPPSVPLLAPPQPFALAVVRCVRAVQGGHSGWAQFAQPPGQRPGTRVLPAANTRAASHI
jgi:hypothetical protein